MPPPSDIVKVAIEWPGANAQLLEIDQKRPLASIIKEVCDGWSLPNPEYYTLRYADGPQLYITEQTRSDIKNGTILQLAISPVGIRLSSGVNLFNTCRSTHHGPDPLLETKTTELKKSIFEVLLAGLVSGLSVRLLTSGS